ncbi:hypothetical protein BDZ94DRAFT_1299642 [Collybia nuda]|uniref:Uncharacterized protein n=1 Tax=Collybia nuda TaxID=64659 RepID=A0A9P5Y430_9AGAR|nr:hypothetical protein BDZ94DRAFT_1299642 [Collybia nuda]
MCGGGAGVAMGAGWVCGGHGCVRVGMDAWVQAPGGRVHRVWVLVGAVWAWDTCVGAVLGNKWTVRGTAVRAIHVRHCEGGVWQWGTNFDKWFNPLSMQNF